MIVLRDKFNPEEGREWDFAFQMMPEVKMGTMEREWNYVGHLNVASMRVAMEVRPSRWNLFWMRVLLGWTWTAYPEVRHAVLGHGERGFSS
jgi:hypothetical protein